MKKSKKNRCGGPGGAAKRLPGCGTTKGTPLVSGMIIGEPALTQAWAAKVTLVAVVLKTPTYQRLVWMGKGVLLVRTMTISSFVHGCWLM